MQPPRASTSDSFHVAHSHAKDGQLIRLASQSATCGHHVAQLGYVSGHFVATAALDFTVALSVS